LIADTGIERNTRQVVEHVLSRAERNWWSAKYLYEAADNLIDLVIKALESRDSKWLGELMDFNQGLLYAMGATSSRIEQLLFAARAAGALGAKLTGAGWGGSVIVFAWEDDADKIKNALIRSGARQVFSVMLGEDGVRLED
jgi:mevalonate kinase